jgi:hypothetical protein
LAAFQRCQIAKALSKWISNCVASACDEISSPAAQLGELACLVVDVGVEPRAPPIGWWIIIRAFRIALGFRCWWRAGSLRDAVIPMQRAWTGAHQLEVVASAAYPDAHAAQRVCQVNGVLGIRYFAVAVRRWSKVMSKALRAFSTGWSNAGGLCRWD